MLCRDKIIVLFCFVDDLLKAMGHIEDSRTEVKNRMQRF